jgi:hypothetical protein
MAAFEDFEYFRNAASRGTATAPPPALVRRGGPAPVRDPLRIELQRLHVELRRMRRIVDRRTRWSERLRRLVRAVVPANKRNERND